MLDRVATKLERGGWLRRLLGRGAKPAPAPSAPPPPDPVAELIAPCSTEQVMGGLAAAGFSVEAYLQANPDLSAACPTAEAAGRHLLLSAKAERRRFPFDLRPEGLARIQDLPLADRSFVASLLATLADVVTDMGPLPQPERVPEVARLAETFRPVGGRPYAVIGDSHSTFYRRSSVREGEFLVPIHVCCSAGSAIELANAESRSGYGELIRGLLPHLEGLPLVLQFGQVDLEFVHPFRRIRAGVTAFDGGEFLSFCDESVQAYARFLQDAVPAERRGGVTVLGVFPPALSDTALRAGYVNGHVSHLEAMAGDDELKPALQALDWPDLTARTGLHREYNARLEAAVTKAGFRFATDFDALLQHDGMLDPAFIPYGRGEQHHLDLVPTEAVLAARIWRVLDERRPVSPGQLSADGRVISFEDLTEELDPALLPPVDRPGVDESTLTPEQLSWRRDGVVELRRFMPPELVDAYVAFRAGATGPGGWAMPTPYLHVPELRALALYPPLMQTLESLVGEKMMLHLALTGWRSTEREWHQDDYLNPPFVAGWYAAVWMALDDISPDSGPFEYLPGSHRWGLLRMDKVRSFLTEEELNRREPDSGANQWPKYAERFVTPAVDRRIEQSGLPIRSFLARKGDVLIWHGRLMHRGSLPRVAGTERRSLITHYSGVNHRPDMPNRAEEHGSAYAVFDHPFK